MKPTNRIAVTKVWPGHRDYDVLDAADRELAEIEADPDKWVDETIAENEPCLDDCDVARVLDELHYPPEPPEGMAL